MPPRKPPPRDELRLFFDWCSFYGVEMPAEPREVANYLLEMLCDGESETTIKNAAAKITRYYADRGYPLKRLERPVRAALEMVKAQLSKDRVLN